MFFLFFFLHEITSSSRCKSNVHPQTELVEELRSNPSKAYSIICDDLRRVYPARDGNPPKVAVKGFSLAVPRGECMGILGPNGAGKTSSINMVCRNPGAMMTLMIPASQNAHHSTVLELSFNSMGLVVGSSFHIIIHCLFSMQHY